MKKINILIAMIMTFALSVALVSAVNPSGATVSNELDFGEFNSTINGGSITVEAGNTSQANLDANMSTYRWVGVTGNTTGHIELGDSSNNVLFDWTALGKVVYAAETNTIDWSGLVALNPATDLPAYLITGSSDNFTNTFNASDDSVTSGIFSGAAALPNTYYADTYDNASNAAWRTFAYSDGTQDVYVGEVNETAGALNFRGEDADYQIILPENGTNSDTTVDTFYLWLELE